MQNTTFIRGFDARGNLAGVRLDDLRAWFDEVGALRLFNTGLKTAEGLKPLMAQLGFAAHEQFALGGRTAESFQAKWAAEGLRRMDYYPPHLNLLPNNEVQYQRNFPSRVLMFCMAPGMSGGNTYLHAAKAVEYRLAADSLGRRLLARIADEGLMIESGFLDESHPDKAQNYNQSWQERFGADDPEVALKTAIGRSDEYDTCWWRVDDGYRTLMTRITLAGFATHRDGQEYLRFPRIAMDGPLFRNGYRRFLLGGGDSLTPDENALLRIAYSETAEGEAWNTGDILLMDNIRYGHSRDPFTGAREILVGMAGLERIGQARKNKEGYADGTIYNRPQHGYEYIPG